MPNDIVEARPLGGHRLYLRYDDGVEGEIDLAPLLTFTEVFTPLRDPAYLAQLRVDPDAGTIVWPNGADLCPDVLRHHLTGKALPGRTDPARRAGWRGLGLSASIQPRSSCPDLIRASTKTGTAFQTARRWPGQARP
ncbi:MAG: DUF2442 domain-containing protein [Alphaproteobacteria bacterium]